jgi:ribonuclease HI
MATVRKIRILDLVYESIQWDKVSELSPRTTREDVDAVFDELRDLLAATPEPQGDLASFIAGDGVYVYSDGTSKGNPGPSGLGLVLTTPEGIELAAWGAPLGLATSNVAEYRAAIAGLTRALDLGAREVRLLSDSQLLIWQIKGKYNVHSVGLMPLYEAVLSLLDQFESWSVSYIPRERNERAHTLAIEAANRARVPRRTS